MVTPYELLIALGCFEWESRITTDFQACVQSSSGTIAPLDEDDEEKQQEKLEHHQLMVSEYGELANVFEQSVIERFREMSFQGLEISDDSTPATLENGKFGIASGYTQTSGNTE